jgi:hypothetical protein
MRATIKVEVDSRKPPAKPRPPQNVTTTFLRLAPSLSSSSSCCRCRWRALGVVQQINHPSVDVRVAHTISTTHIHSHGICWFPFCNEYQHRTQSVSTSTSTSTSTSISKQHGHVATLVVQGSSLLHHQQHTGSGRKRSRSTRNLQRRW